MDDPVAIALLLSGSSAALALVLIGRRLLAGRDEQANPEPARREPASAQRSMDLREDRPAEAADGDVFAARISADAPDVPATPDRVATPAEADVFAARISPDAEVETSPAEPDDVFAGRISDDAESEAAADPVSAPADGDVFADRISADAEVEAVAPSSDDAPDAPPDDVFASRISADEQATPVAATNGAAPADPFSRFVDETSDEDDDENRSESVYPEDTCRDFAQGLKDEVLDRALTLFWALAREGSIDSNDLGALLGARSRQAGALVSTPMKRRAEAMDLPLPYVIGRSSASRLRTWSDHFGIAARMAAALLEEQEARDTTGDDPAEGLAGLTAWLGQQTDDEVRISLEEIDALGPAGLPEHALNERNWWANRSGGPGHGHAEAWLAAGRLAYPDLKAGEIAFELLAGLEQSGGESPMADTAEIAQ